MLPSPLALRFAMRIASIQRHNIPQLCPNSQGVRAELSKNYHFALSLKVSFSLFSAHQNLHTESLFSLWRRWFSSRVDHPSVCSCPQGLDTGLCSLTWVSVLSPSKPAHGGLQCETWMRPFASTFVALCLPSSCRFHVILH